MKTYLNHIAYLLLATAIICSCKKETCETSTTTTTITETTSEYQDGNSNNVSGSAHEANGGDLTRSSRSGSADQQGSASGSSAKTSGKKSGYSAADGTPAENRDGDMYTRHDTTPMPSGVPIK